MDKTEKILELLEGSLDSESQRRLFSELSYNGELREQFKSASAISQSIKSNISTFEPSTAVKNRIFSKAGFAIPGASAKSQNPKSKPFYRTAPFANLMSAAAATFITVLIMLYLLGGNSSGKKINPLPVSNLEHNYMPGNTNSLKKNEMLASQSPSVAKDSAPVEIIKYIYIENNNEPVKAPVAEDIQNRPYEHIRESNSDIENPRALIRENNMSSRLDLTEEISTPGPGIGYDTEKPYNIQLEFAGAANLNALGKTRPPSEISGFNNTSLRLYWLASENIKAGLEIENETYYNEYFGYEGNSYYKYKQNTNLTTLSARLRLAPDILKFGKFSFYGDLGAGVNRGGFALKPELGLDFSPYPDVSFFAGIGYDWFWFNHGGQFFNTQKWGFIYGASFKF